MNGSGQNNALRPPVLQLGQASAGNAASNFNPYGLQTNQAAAAANGAANFSLNNNQASQSQQFSLTGIDYLHENELALVLSHLCKMCSPQSMENIFKGYLYSKFP